MVKERNNNAENKSDQQIFKEKMKEIKKAKKRGNEQRAQRLADELFIWLGWDDGF